MASSSTIVCLRTKIRNKLFLSHFLMVKQSSLNSLVWFIFSLFALVPQYLYPLSVSFNQFRLGACPACFPKKIKKNADARFQNPEYWIPFLETPLIEIETPARPGPVDYHPPWILETEGFRLYYTTCMGMCG
jgi:hypothetical protein